MKRLQDFNFDCVGSSVSSTALLAFENEVGGVLDPTLSDFLLHTNGGIPDPELRSSLKELPFELVLFLGYLEGYEGLRRGFRELEERNHFDYANRLLPFAIDTAGRRLCICIGLKASPVVVADFSTGEIAIAAEDFSTLVDSLSHVRDQLDAVEVLAQKRWDEIAKFLEDGGDINQSSASGLSLLCQAIRFENYDVVKNLVAAGADLQGAIEIAVTNQLEGVVKMLVDQGASAHEGLRFAVGPRRRDIREYLRSVAEAN